MERIATDENLIEAWKEVRRKGGQPGGDGISIECFAQKLSYNLEGLKRDLVSNAYYPGAIRSFQMLKSDGKTRLIGILPIRDRVAQRAFLRILDPIYEKEFLNCSFGYRRGRGVDGAINRVLALLDQGLTWLVDTDIEACYDSIPHDKLKKIILHKMHDASVRRVLSLWLAQTPSNGDSMKRLGLLQGAIISPLLANVYLNEFDKEMNKRGWSHVRYADDLIAACDTRGNAKRCLEEMVLILGRMALKPKKDKTRIINADQGFTFLGRDAFPAKARERIEIRKKSYPGISDKIRVKTFNPPERRR